MYLPDFTEYCPKCGAKVIRAAFTAKQRKVCRICGHAFIVPITRMGVEKTKPIFRFTWEKVLLVIAIVVFVAFAIGVEAAQRTVYA